jgi:O-acetyl-ADP-ribose deacetylase (regulator of RNase III)
MGTCNINYIGGSATELVSHTGIRIVAHVCNNVGGFGAGFAGHIAKKWPIVKDQYKLWYKNGTSAYLPLGATQIVPVRDEHGIIFVANMIAQSGYKVNTKQIPLQYDRLDDCLKQLNTWIGHYTFTKKLMMRHKELGEVSIHMPRIGCGLAGGKWGEVFPIICNTISKHKIFVYDLPKNGKTI